MRALTALAVAVLVTAGLAATGTVSAASDQPDLQPGQGFFNSALPLALTGDAHVTVPTGLAYVSGADEATRFTLTASSLTIERHAWTATRVLHPTTGEEVYGHYDQEEPDVRTFTDAAVQGTNGRSGMILIAHGDASSPAPRVTLESIPNARATLTGDAARTLADQDPEVKTNEVEWWLPVYEVHGPHVTARAVPDLVRVQGNFTLRVWDLDLEVTPTEGAAETVRTGRHDGHSAYAVEESEIAYALVHVTNGILETTGTSAAEVLGARVLVDVTGTGVVPAAVGGYRAGETKYEATGQDVRFTGNAHLETRLVDGRTDRALVDLSGTLSAVSLPAQAAPAPGDGFLGSAAGRAAATGTGALLLLVGAAVLAGGERRQAARRFVRPLRAPVRSRTERVEDAVAALADGDDARAVKVLEPLLAESPTDVVLLVDYGCALERLGRVRPARDAFETAVQEDPGNAEAHYYYARVLARLNLSASALPHLQRAIALDSRLAEMAARDDGFRSLADHPSFVALTG